MPLIEIPSAKAYDDAGATVVNTKSADVPSDTATRDYASEFDALKAQVSELRKVVFGRSIDG